MSIVNALMGISVVSISPSNYKLDDRIYIYIYNVQKNEHLFPLFLIFIFKKNELMKMYKYFTTYNIYIDFKCYTSKI